MSVEQSSIEETSEMTTSSSICQMVFCICNVEMWKRNMRCDAMQWMQCDAKITRAMMPCDKTVIQKKKVKNLELSKRLHTHWGMSGGDDDEWYRTSKQTGFFLPPSRHRNPKRGSSMGYHLPRSPLRTGRFPNNVCLPQLQPIQNMTLCLASWFPALPLLVMHVCPWRPSAVDAKRRCARCATKWKQEKKNSNDDKN